MQAALAAGASWPGAIAVSGGGDSIALMVLVAEWAAAGGRVRPAVVTVDHRLHPGSSHRAVAVVAQANARGLDAEVLVWRGRKPAADIENAARIARYGLLGDWCRSRGVGSLYVAHTLEDQAETFLLRLARGSGVDGLAAMSVVSPFPQPGREDLQLVRPLLAVSHRQLRAVLLARGALWHEDPMNADTRFARVRLRTAWPEFARAGLSAARIAQAAGHLARARAALDRETDAFLARASQERDAGLLLDGAGLAELSDEIALRALARVLMQVSGQTYRPRMDRLEHLLAAIHGTAVGKGRTLHGCWIKPAPVRERCFGPQTLWVTPEPARRRMVGKSKD